MKEKASCDILSSCFQHRISLSCPFFPEARHIFQGLSFCFIKEKVKLIVADELEPIANDENRKHLLQQK
ncbi:hypothetical protein [Phocaeicola sartorii]|uniref:Uncharacterized protein n=1 Tax=Phocaeicola sartorii TaxID=671267 RepID=A0A4S2FGY6_9BACT|nr:hypothetical protein [Phocaeicola sartorii]TGY68070.1 hypothetical protein E5339_17940 [Phocaeicola sartorii]